MAAPYSKSKYDEEDVLNKLDKYLEECYEDGTEILGGGGNAKIFKKVKLPSKIGFARFIGVSTSTLSRWCNKHPDLKEKVELITDSQFQKLVENGLGGQYNATIVKLLLTKHGYSDKIDQNLNANDKLIYALELAHERTKRKADGGNTESTGKSS